MGRAVEIQQFAQTALAIVFVFLESWALFGSSGKISALSLEERAAILAASSRDWLNVSLAAALTSFTILGIAASWRTPKQMIVFGGFFLPFLGELVLRFSQHLLSSSGISPGYIVWVSLMGVGLVVSAFGVVVLPVRNIPARLRFAACVALCGLESSFFIAALAGRGLVGGIVFLVSAAVLGGLLAFLRFTQSVNLPEVFEDEEVLIRREAYPAVPSAGEEAPFLASP